MVSCCLPLFQCFELVAVLIPDPDEVFTAVVGHFVGTIEPVDVSLTVTSDQPSFVLLRHGRLFGGVLASSGITGFALLMGVAFFKAQFRVSTYCLEMAAIPLATMQIRRIGLAAADAWQIGVARTDKGVESFLSLSLVVSVWPELCQPLLAAFAPVLFSLFCSLMRLAAAFTFSFLRSSIARIAPCSGLHHRIRMSWNFGTKYSPHTLHLRRDGLRMGTTLNLYQREVSAEHGTSIDVHLVGILQGLARRGVAEDKQISTSYRRDNAVLSVANPFTIPDDHVFRDRLVERIFVMRVVSVADNDFTFSGNQLDDEWQAGRFMNQSLSQHLFFHNQD